MNGPKLINSGQPAMAAVAKVLPSAKPITVPSSLGTVELKPGTIWSGNRMLVVATPTSVVYSVDDRLYEWGTGSFVRDEYLNAFPTAAASASHWVTIAQVEFALLSGIFVPWYVLLGMSCAKAGLFYKTNQQVVDEAFRQGPKVLKLLQDLRRRSPTLFDALMKSAAKDLLANLPSGVSAEDVAFFVGRVIKGAAAAGPELTIGALVKIVATVAALVTATHLPSIAAHTAAHAAGQKAAELKRALAASGYTVTDAEAKAIVKEVMSQPDTHAMLRQLEQACKALVPTLTQLKSAYGAMH
jgi:hypothetical protein